MSQPGDRVTVSTQHSVQDDFVECCISKHANVYTSNSLAQSGPINRLKNTLLRAL